VGISSSIGKMIAGARVQLSGTVSGAGYPGSYPAGPLAKVQKQKTSQRQRSTRDARGETPGSLAMAQLAHQSEQVPLGIAKEGHPQIVIRHSGDDVGLVFKAHVLRKQLLVGGLNVGNTEIEN